jgi:hypothetical protein
MQQTSRVGLQNVTAGFMIVAFAVAILLAWLMDSWWMFFPILFIEVGGFYTALGLAGVRSEGPSRRGPSSSSYYVFWGPTLVILGVMWVLSAETDVSGVLLFVVFLLWVGGIAMALSLRKKGSAPQA